MKIHIICAALATVILTAGCAAKSETIPALECTAQSSVSHSPIHLDLPEGYWIPTETATVKECSIFCAGQRVGGVIKTDLSTDMLVNADFDTVREYLGQYVPDGLVYDTMIDGVYPVTADMVLVDPDTKASREFMHYLYEQDGICYDLWLDFAYLQYWEHKEILVTSGIAPNLEIIQPESGYVPNFENTGLNLGEPDGNTCPIVSDGKIIGGFDYTELAPVVLDQQSDFLNMEEADPECSYPQMSVSEFRIRKYLQRHIPEGWTAEYAFMYENQDTADRSVSVSMVLTNSETGEQRSYLHQFFCWEPLRIYDSWNENTEALLPEGTN